MSKTTRVISSTVLNSEYIFTFFHNVFVHFNLVPCHSHLILQNLQMFRVMMKNTEWGGLDRRGLYLTGLAN